MFGLLKLGKLLQLTNSLQLVGAVEPQPSFSIWEHRLGWKVDLTETHTFPSVVKHSCLMPKESGCVTSWSASPFPTKPQ